MGARSKPVYVYAADKDGCELIGKHPGPAPADAIVVDFFDVKLTVSSTRANTARHICAIRGADVYGCRNRNMQSSDYMELEYEISIFQKMFGSITDIFDNPKHDCDHELAMIYAGYPRGNHIDIGGISVYYGTYTAEYHVDGCDCWDDYNTLPDYNNEYEEYWIPETQDSICVCHTKKERDEWITY